MKSAIKVITVLSLAAVLLTACGKGNSNEKSEKEITSATETSISETTAPEATETEKTEVSAEGYNDEELIQMALDFYSANNDGYVPSLNGIQDNGDGTVTIQLYDNLGDHNSTSAWYTVDRKTAEGTDDIMGDKIDLKP